MKQPSMNYSTRKSQIDRIIVRKFEEGGDTFGWRTRSHVTEPNARVAFEEQESLIVSTVEMHAP